jgi:secondary thiamine-phosphate synthase enzyme
MEVKIYKQKIEFESTNQIEFIDITSMVQDVVEKSGIREGNVTVYAPHTTMGVIINHNEPMLVQDFMRVLYKLVPADDRYSHDLFELRKGKVRSDARSNGHSHCKSMIVGISETILLDRGKMILSESQNIFAVELDGGRKRDVVVQVMGI